MALLFCGLFLVQEEVMGVVVTKEVQGWEMTEEMKAIVFQANFHQNMKKE